MPEIIKADPVYRRRLFLGYALGLFLIVDFWLYFPAFIRSQFQPGSFVYNFWVLQLAGLFLLLLFIPATLYLIRFGNQVSREERFPPLGMKTIMDTPVQTGRPARIRGRLYAVLGWTGLTFLLLGMIATHVIFLMIKRDPFIWFR
jgi:hypothetical protein